MTKPRASSQQQCSVDRRECQGGLADGVPSSSELRQRHLLAVCIAVAPVEVDRVFEQRDRIPWRAYPHLEHAEIGERVGLDPTVSRCPARHPHGVEAATRLRELAEIVLDETEIAGGYALAGPV